MADRGYFFLLSHLHRPTTSLSLSTLQASIAHYLAHLTQPPTSLAGSVVSSPLFQPLSHAKLEVLCTAFRHAAQLKVKVLQEESSSLFSRSVQHRLGVWTKSVLDGLRGGHPTLKLVCCGGLLSGLEDLDGEVHTRDGRIRKEVEEDVIVALAEVMDTYSYVRFPADWAKDFKSESEDGQEPLSLSLLLSSRFMPLVSARRLETLPLPILSDLLISTMESAFRSGRYVHIAVTSLRNGQGEITASKDIEAISSSHFIGSMATLSKFSSCVLSVLAESRPVHGWSAMAHALARMENLSSTVERDWQQSSFAAFSDGSESDPQAHSVAQIRTQLWVLLKTQLFATVMLCQTVLSTLAFSPHPSVQLPHQTEASSLPSPHALARSVLLVLSHMAFVIQQFGGVTSTAQSGFHELKRVFYMALDILSADVTESERFVTTICFLGDQAQGSDALDHIKKAYVLACIEQLVPVLGDTQIRTTVFPTCSPHLADPIHRETYESAHSVMLAVFASHAQRPDEHMDAGRDSTDDSSPPLFVEEIVPFYTQCLIENSDEGKLSTVQLCMAYAALVRSAAAFDRQKGVHPGHHTEGDVFSLYCVERLIDTIRQTTDTPPPAASQRGHLHRLQLALIATLPSVSLTLLPRLLEQCKELIIESAPTSVNGTHSDAIPERRNELVRALFKEISENVGDAEKEFCMQWWSENKHSLSEAVLPGKMVDESSSSADVALVSRL